MDAYHAGTLDFVSASGSLLSTTSAEPDLVFGGESGFIGYVVESATSSLAAWTDSGVQLARAAFGGNGLPAAEDPLGGVVELGGGTTPQIVSYDPSLSVRWTVTRPTDDPVALAVDRAGATLFLFDGTRYFGANTLAGMWVDHAGVAGDVFEMLGPQHDLAFRLPFAMTQRTGSGLFLALGPTWIAEIDSLATASSRAPACLIRQGTCLRTSEARFSRRLASLRPG
jgi:hypothetical protein